MSNSARVRLFAVAALILVMPPGCAKESTGRPETESTASPGASAQTPASGDSVTLTEPGLVIEWPDGWSETQLVDLRTQLEGQAKQVPAEFQGTFRRLVKQIDDGVIVAHATGPVVNGAHAPSIIVSVESGDQSLGSAAKRREAFLQALTSGMGQQIDERSSVALSVGRAMRIRASSKPSIGIPSQTIEYVLLLDERTVSIFGTAPADHTQFVDVMAGVADRLSRP